MPRLSDGTRQIISGGPSKFDLMLSLLDGSNAAGTRRRVSFMVDDIGEIEVVVNRLSREDGSGESWNFEGFAQTFGPSYSYDKVEGYFSTRSRRGTIRLKN